MKHHTLIAALAAASTALGAGTALAQGMDMDHGAMGHGDRQQQDMGGMGHMGHMQPMHRFPTSLQGAHLLGQGETMLSYQYMFMDMDGNRDGTSSLSAAGVRAAGFPVVPVEMSMDMHMLMGMYGLTDRATVMAMGSFVTMDMDHLAGAPLGAVQFSTQSKGIGDITAGVLWGLYEADGHSLHLNALVGLPTGDIDAKDQLPTGYGQLPYPMQLGSGTFDLKPGITYTRHLDDWSYGAQALATLRLGDNDRDYTLGDRYRLTGWVARDVARRVAVTARLDGQTWGDIDGADPVLNPALVPTADPSRRAGTRLDFGVGVNAGAGPVTLGLDLALPVYQHLDGPQLETDYTVTATLKAHF